MRKGGGDRLGARWRVWQAGAGQGGLGLGRGQEQAGGAGQHTALRVGPAGGAGGGVGVLRLLMRVGPAVEDLGIEPGGGAGD